MRWAVFKTGMKKWRRLILIILLRRLRLAAKWIKRAKLDEIYKSTWRSNGEWKGLKRSESGVRPQSQFGLRLKRGGHPREARWRRWTKRNRRREGWSQSCHTPPIVAAITSASNCTAKARREGCHSCVDDDVPCSTRQTNKG